MLDPATDKPLPIAVVPPAPGGPEVANVSRATGRFELPPEFSNAPKGESEPPAGETPAAPAEAESATPPSDATSETPTGDEQPEAEKPKTLSPEQRQERRLNRAYQKAAEAKARAQLLEQELARVKAGSPKPEQAEDSEPKLEQFDDIEKYAAAKAKWEVDKALKAKEQEAQVKAREEAQKKQREYVENLTSAWEKRSIKGAEKYDDWDDVVGELKPTTPFSIAIMGTENGHDVAHFLGKNPKEAHRIASLDPISQAREIGVISAKLLLQEKPPAKPSKAPPPIKPVSGASEITEVKDSSEPGIPFQEFMRRRHRELGRKVFN